MKILASIIAFLLIIVPTFAQQTDGNKKDEFVGKVKSVLTQDFNYDDEKQKRKVTPKERGTIFFDEKGNEIERIVYDDYGFPFGKEVLKYNANGLLSENVLTNEKNEIVAKSRFEYKDGKLIQSFWLDASNVESLKTVYSYDEIGRKSEESYYIQLRLVGKTIYKYDENSNLTEIAFFNSVGNKANAPIGPCRSSHKLVYSYPNVAKKDVKVVSYDAKDNVKETLTYAYDEKGRLTEYSKVGSGLKYLAKYAYEEDEKGNWIKRTATIENIMTFKMLGQEMPSIKRITVTERKITY